MFLRAFGGICGPVIGIVLMTAPRTLAQHESAAPADRGQQRLQELEESLHFGQDALARKVDEQMLFHRLEDLAQVDAVRYTGPPPRVNKNPTGQGAGNPIILNAYTFMPRKHAAGRKIPLIILVHGGVHGTFNTTYVNVVRELLSQGYAVLAPEYRGSIGQGRELWQQIDYGGLENEDVFAGKQWMLENNDSIDPARVGIMGWSHGGMITLMNLFDHPRDYKVGYAGVPVSDLVARMGYKGDDYRELFSAPYHIGKTAEDNVNEYRRRSPGLERRETGNAAAYSHDDQ
jgi:dipeptidyl aminopeptidase/acylaminoacyl peptidase